MDLANLKTNVLTTELSIPGIGDTGMVLQLRYESSPEVQAVHKKMRDMSLVEAQKGKRGDKKKVLDWFEKARAVAHIAGWSWKEGAMQYDGGHPEFSEATAKEMLFKGDEFAFFLRDFIEEQIGDASDFLGKSA